MNKTKILIAEDHKILRDGLKSILSLEKDIEIVGEASNGREALLNIRDAKPNLILMDLSMPNTNGTEATKSIKQRYPDIKIIILTVHKSEEYIHATLKAGADGYVLKDDSSDVLISAIKSVSEGNTYLSACICNNIVNGYLNGASGSENSTRASWELLTHREREVLKLIAEGSRNKDIAAYLSLSPKTVEKHRSNLMKKLDLHSASSLTSYAISIGLVTH